MVSMSEHARALRLLFARRAAESRMNEEIGFHIDMETDRLVREEGLSPRRHGAARSPPSAASPGTPRRCATAAASRGSRDVARLEARTSECWSSIRD